VTHQPRHFRFAIAAFVAILSCAQPVNAASQTAAELRTEYRALSAEFVKSAPGWQPKAPASGSLLFIAPDQYTPAGDEGRAFRDARNEYANSLFALAKRAAAAGQLSLAFQWATETVRENPDHADARHVLGYEARDGQWLTAYGVKMFDAGKTWDPRLGWVSNNGEREPAQKSKDNWIVRTDHFLVSTNDSQQAAAELAARLERLHQVWRQLFAGFYLQEREVRQLFAGERDARGQSKPFRVYYYRNRADYADALRRRQPRIDETLGIYFDTFREAHFFAGEEQDAGTLYHETVHQLFQESRPAAKMIGKSANFWIIEGVATYFETLAEHNDREAGLYYTVGESSAGRLPMARQRVLEDGYYMPLAELCKLNKSDVQRQPEIAKLYGQAAGLAAFLMDADDGRYREPLVTYLEAVYAGRDDAETLAHATGLSDEQLDAAYRRFMQSLP
jgi:hypothetical protein